MLRGQSKRTFCLQIICAVALFLIAISASAQQAPAPHDMSQMKMEPDRGFMQEGMHHAIAKGVTLSVALDPVTHVVTLREGPMSLRAHTGHMAMPQPPDQIWEIPFDGWLLAYHPSLVDAKGNSVPGRVLHHTAFWNLDRSDFLCANKAEHIFGAGSEMTDWGAVPGFGYRVQKGDRIRIETMVWNPTYTSYDRAYLEVRIPYQEASAAAAAEPRNVYPAWMDVQSCGNSGYDLPAGKSTRAGMITVNYNGVLLGVGGHLHDYGQQLVLKDLTNQETVATLDAQLDSRGQLISVPVVSFFDTGGYRFNRGDELEILATYDNVTGKPIREGAMGIVVGYFVPDDDTALASLRRTTKTATKAPMGSDH